MSPWLEDYDMRTNQPNTGRDFSAIYCNHRSVLKTNKEKAR